MSDPLVELRTLLYDEPSPTCWAQLTSIIGSSPEVSEPLVEYALVHIHEWPRALRVFEPATADFAWPPWIRLACGLNLSRLGLTDDHLRRIAASHELSGMVAIDLSHNQLHVAGLSALATSPHLEKLERLNLDSCGLDAESVEGLLESSFRPRQLSLARCVLEDRGAELLANAALLERCEHLDLGGNDIGKPGVEALARSNRLGALERLNLRQNPIGNLGVAELLAHTQLPNLTELLLSGCGIGPDGCAALVRSPAASRLATLELNLNRIGDDGARALATGEFPALTELALNQTEVGPEGTVAIASAPWVSQLTSLSMWGNSAGLRGAEALSSIDAPEMLSLRVNSVGVEGLACLDGAEGMPNLRRLEVGTVLYGPDDDLAALVTGLQRPEILASLYLYPAGRDSLYWRPTPDVRRRVLELLGCEGIEGLRAIRMSNNGLDDRALMHLADNPGLSTIERLGLARNPSITDMGVDAIANSPYAHSVRHLELSSTAITDAAIESLATSPNMANLRRLDLEFTAITDASARVLAYSRVLSNLEEVRLPTGRLTPAGHDLLARSDNRSLARSVLHRTGLTQLRSYAVHIGIDSVHRRHEELVESILEATAPM